MLISSMKTIKFLFPLGFMFLPMSFSRHSMSQVYMSIDFVEELKLRFRMINSSVSIHWRKFLTTTVLDTPLSPIKLME